MWEFFNCKNLTKISARVYNLSIILVGSPLGDISFANWQGGKKMRDVFSNHAEDKGYTYEEAEIRKAKIDEAHGVGTPKAKWAEAKIESDPRGGYLVTIETLN